MLVAARLESTDLTRAMGTEQNSLSKMFNRFFASEKSSGVLLMFCTALALAITNSSFGERYLGRADQVLEVSPSSTGSTTR